MAAKVVIYSEVCKRTKKYPYGSEHEEEYRKLASRYFDADGVMLEETYQQIEEFEQ